MDNHSEQIILTDEDDEFINYIFKVTKVDVETIKIYYMKNKGDTINTLIKLYQSKLYFPSPEEEDLFKDNIKDYSN